MRLERLDLAAAHLRFLICPHHPRDVGPVDVGIHEPHAVTPAGQRDGEVRGDRGFPDAALARRDREDLAEMRQLDGRRGWRDGAGRGAWGTLPGTRAALRGACIGDVDAHGGHTLDPLRRLPHLARERAWVVAAEEERERDRTGVVGGEILDHAARQDVTAAARVLELGQSRKGAPGKARGEQGRGATTGVASASDHAQVGADDGCRVTRSGASRRRSQPLMPVPVTNRSRLAMPAFGELAARVGQHVTLERILAWGRAEIPVRRVEEIVTQDEFTHDVLVALDAPLYLAYDVT